MEQFTGKVIEEAIAIGPVLMYQKEWQVTLKYDIEDVKAEEERFGKALEQAKRMLSFLCEKAAVEAGKSGAAIMEGHRLIMEDEEYLDSVYRIIKEQRVNAEYAVAVTEKKFAAIFTSMEDEYMQMRASDVTDVSRRLIQLLGGTKEGVTITEPVILYAKELSPSEMVRLDKSRLLAIVTEMGSTNSHTAILARNMGIPALTGISLPESANGKPAIVDGYTGTLILEPDRKVFMEYQKRKIREEAEQQALQERKGKATLTKNGKEVFLYANINHVSDMEAVLENDAEGIGLLRSEFLYMEAEAYPSEEEQFQVYRQVAEQMKGKKVIIRTLDIGADKQADYFDLKQEANPAMGLRAIRICLERPEIFKTQLRAILRASAYGTVAVMFPMITSLWELKKAKELLKEAKQELAGEGIRFKDIEIGVMIETPAAVMISDLLAKEADFFSIGTNDLTQYTLAADRQNQQMDLFYNTHHEAILRMIEMTVKHGHKEKIKVGICGELGADMELTQRFLEMGVDELSVSPTRILPLRRLIEGINVG